MQYGFHLLCCAQSLRPPRLSLGVASSIHFAECDARKYTEPQPRVGSPLAQRIHLLQKQPLASALPRDPLAVTCTFRPPFAPPRPRPQANSGELVLMVGGSRAAFDKATPLFGAVGRLWKHMGPNGSGAVIKLCVHSSEHCGAAVIGLSTIAQLPK